MIFRSYVSLPEGRSHRQLSIVIQQTSIFGYLCAVCRQSWRHWNLGNSYFLGWWIHTSTCTSCTSDKPCKIHLQNQDHLSYQILPYPTIFYQILPTYLGLYKSLWRQYKKQQHILDEDRWSTSWQCEQIEVPKNTYQVFLWWIRWSSGFQIKFIPSGNLT